MAQWECIVCGLIYDEKDGWPEDGIAPGTKWADVPDDWTCPDCGVGKDDFELISGGSGDDQINISALLQETFSFNLTNLKGELESIEEVIFSSDDNASVIEVSADAISAFNSGVTDDQDSDGDPDTAIYLLGDYQGDNIDIISASAEDGWVYLESSLAFDYYQSGDGETYFITRIGSPVYEDIQSASSSISNQSIRENTVNGVIGILSFVNLNQLSEGDNIIQFSLSGEDADKFEIIDGNTIRLKSGTFADYENQPVYNLTITLTYQSGSETKTIGLSQNFVITVLDIEENSISGSSASETIVGTEVDDIIDSNGGDDDIDGKDGIDTVLIFDERDNYEIITLSGITKVKALSGAPFPYYNNTITLTNVEVIIFSDQTVQVSDLTSKTSDTGRAIEESIDDDSSMPENNNEESDPINLPSDEQWANDFDFSLIDLPVVADDNQMGSIDTLIAFNELFISEDSMVLDFEFISGDSHHVDINPVKQIKSPLLNIESQESWENVKDDMIWFENI